MQIVLKEKSFKEELVEAIAKAKAEGSKIQRIDLTMEDAVRLCADLNEMESEKFRPFRKGNLTPVYTPSAVHGMKFNKVKLFVEGM